MKYILLSIIFFFATSVHASFDNFQSDLRLGDVYSYNDTIKFSVDFTDATTTNFVFCFIAYGQSVNNCSSKSFTVSASAVSTSTDTLGSVTPNHRYWIMFPVGPTLNSISSFTGSSSINFQQLGIYRGGIFYSLYRSSCSISNTMTCPVFVYNASSSEYQIFNSYYNSIAYGILVATLFSMFALLLTRRGYKYF